MCSALAKRITEYFKKDVENIKCALSNRRVSNLLCDNRLDQKASLTLSYADLPRASDVEVSVQLTFVADGAPSFEEHQHDKITCWM